MPLVYIMGKMALKIGIDISAQSEEPIKKVVLPVKTEEKAKAEAEVKKDTPVVQKKPETKTSDKK